MHAIFNMQPISNMSFVPPSCEPHGPTVPIAGGMYKLSLTTGQVGCRV